MTIDKSWIKLRDRSSPAFLKGLRNFMDIAKNHVNSEGKAPCPCIKCVNRKGQKLETIYAHIHDWGFLKVYETWVHHGERFANEAKVAAIFSKKPRIEEETGEMFDVLDDVRGEQNTNGDEDGTGLDPEFDALFNELNTELYPGCSWMSSLNFLAKLMHIKVANKWTNSSFDQLVEFLRVAFPKDNYVPASHYEAKNKLRKIGLGYQSKIHACVNDCALFWKENASMQNCPICKESRWVDKNTNGNKVPQKVLRYFPLTSRLVFSDILSTDDVEAAYRQPPRDYDEDKWRSLIDNLFMKDEYIKRCQVNAANRAKQPYSSLHGSQSYANRRHMELEETGSSSYIDNWKKMHSRDEIFLNRAAEETFENIEQQKCTLECEVADESIPIDEVEALRRALGTRRGHTRGIGRKLKHTSPTVSSSNYMPQQMQEMQQQMQEMQQQMQEMHALMQQQMVCGPKTGGGRNTNQDSQNDETGEDD